MQKKTGMKMFYTLADMTSLTPNSKPCNFITLWKLIKTPQKFVQSSSSVQFKKKSCHKNWGAVLASEPFFAF